MTRVAQREDASGRTAEFDSLERVAGFAPHTVSHVYVPLGRSTRVIYRNKPRRSKLTWLPTGQPLHARDCRWQSIRSALLELRRPISHTPPPRAHKGPVIFELINAAISCIPDIKITRRFIDSDTASAHRELRDPRPFKHWRHKLKLASTFTRLRKH
jgi:hypothetical protein